MLASGTILGLLKAFEKIEGWKAWHPFWDNEPPSPRAKARTATHANSLKWNAQTKVNRKSYRRFLFLHGTLALSVYSLLCTQWEKMFFYYFFLPSGLHLHTHNQSTHQSWILPPMKWRTYFPFIIKLYGLVVKMTWFGVNCIWVWFEANYLNSLRVHFLIFQMG